MKIEVSFGEVLDKISILEIKLEKITDKKQYDNVKKEYDSLVTEVKASDLAKWLDADLYCQLLKVNHLLWQIEDDIRKKEYYQQFDDDFIKLARRVYILNDARASIKRNINIETRSSLIEEKYYFNYESEGK